MKNKELRSNFILLLAAAIWGFAFVAQRVGVEFVPAFTFNGVRFLLGSLSLLPLIIFFNIKNKNIAKEATKKPAWPVGIISGCVLFIAASLQQIGMQSTSAGKAGFITGLYLVIVPLIGIFLGHRVHVITWVSVFIAAIGLYFISITGSFTIGYGDRLLLIGAFFWALHIILIDRFTKTVDSLKLSLFQFLTCAALSLGGAAIFDRFPLQNLFLAAIPIIYGGVCSVGIAYTCQVIGQKHAKPSHSAIILSMESLFACLGGWLILKENLGIRGYIGSVLMIGAMLLSQSPNLSLKMHKTLSATEVDFTQSKTNKITAK